MMQQVQQMQAEMAAKGQTPPGQEVPEDDPQQLVQEAMNLLA